MEGKQNMKIRPKKLKGNRVGNLQILQKQGEIYKLFGNMRNMQYA